MLHVTDDVTQLKTCTTIMAGAGKGNHVHSSPVIVKLEHQSLTGMTTSVAQT